MSSYAKVIEDSINEEGVRLTTFELRFRRFVLSEFNTHCVLSRNSASSRAIPVTKQLMKVWGEPAFPATWPAEQKGMQGGAELTEGTVRLAKHHWLAARDAAATRAEELLKAGVHKSVTNRLLEPFMWHTAVVTATAWDNFFEQRCSPLAQPEIREVAELMQQARIESEPQLLEDGMWHLPYVDPDTFLEMAERGMASYTDLAKVSAARCARVSYLTQDGRRDVEEDLKLYERLVTARPAHWSPLEHVATPWLTNVQSRDPSFWFVGDDSFPYAPPTEHLPRVGKLLMYRTLRTTVETQLDVVTYR